MPETTKRQIEKYLLLVFLSIFGLATISILIVFAGGTPHVPRFSSGSCSFSDQCQLSSNQARQTTYASLDRDEVDVYVLNFEPGETIDLSLIVPNKILSEVRVPAIKVVGPGLPVTSTVPDWANEGDGMIVYSDDDRIAFANSASLRQWILVQPVQFEIPEKGTYYLVVFDEVGEPGEYGLWLEGRDPIKINELFKMLVGIIRLNI